MKATYPTFTLEYIINAVVEVVASRQWTSVSHIMSQACFNKAEFNFELQHSKRLTNGRCTVFVLRKMCHYHNVHCFTEWRSYPPRHQQSLFCMHNAQCGGKNRLGCWYRRGNKESKLWRMAFIPRCRSIHFIFFLYRFEADVVTDTTL